MKEKQNFLWFFARFFVILPPEIIKGCRQLAAEMIPSKPDAGNTDVGMIELKISITIPLFYIIEFKH